jgi:hypothetical protein
MLFSYPVAAAAENWLHECLVTAVKTVHEFIDEGKRLPKWPNVLPAAYRGRLSSRTGLAERFTAYANAITALGTAERESVLEALEAQNKIPELLARQCDCLELADLPPGVREPAKALFTFGFDLLTPFEIRQRQYKTLCAVIPVRVCPFCGCEGLDAPGAPQEDLDHYIPRSRYPFAAANLRNLAPMGGRCNSAYKKTQDPLRRATGERRLAFDPYEAAGVTISFENSVVDELTVGPVVSSWVIDFLPASEEVETWDEIFHIRERWKRDVLDEKTIMQWLGEFQSYCRRAKRHACSDADLVDAVRDYEQFLAECGLGDRAFLKAAVFGLLLRQCTVGCQRILLILRDLIDAPGR